MWPTACGANMAFAESWLSRRVWNWDQSSQMWCSCAGPRTGAQRAPSRCEVQSWESCHDVSETTPRSRSQVRACELQNRQWATPVDLGISSQIVICLLFACEYLWYIILHLCRTQTMENFKLSDFFCVGHTSEGRYGRSQEARRPSARGPLDF